MAKGRKVIDLETGKVYASKNRMRDAKYRSWLLKNSEYHQEIIKNARELSMTKEVNEKRSIAAKRMWERNPELRKKRSDEMKQKWNDQEYVDGMLEVIRGNNCQAVRDLKRCGALKRMTTKNGVPVIRFVRGERSKSTGVIIQG